MTTSSPSREPVSDPICLVCGSDENYSQPLSIALFSALKHLTRDRKAVIYVLDGGISAPSQARIRRVVKRARGGTLLHFVTPSSDQLEHMEGDRHISVAAYLRLFIPKLLPPEIQQALYLDCDLLIQGDLAEFWDAGTAGCAVSAIRDFAITHITHPWSHIPGWQQLRIDPQAPTFNTGVLLLDLTYWRQHHITEQVVDYAVRHAGELDNCDQDAINAILASSWRQADESWNVQYSLLYLEELPVPSQTSADFYSALGRNRPKLLRDAKILHFTDSSKPWQHQCFHPATLKWALTLLQSGWFSRREALQWARYWVPRFILTRLKRATGKLRAREKTSVITRPFQVSENQS